MPDLPKKKLGIVACSGEEIAEGTITRLAALKVLEHLRPANTVTICLPLFLAGGEGDRAFARFYPTITIDGCEKRCAARATEMYSGKPAAGIVVTDLRRWSRSTGTFVEEAPPPETREPVEAACSCGAGIPVSKLAIDGQTVTLIALPLIFEQFRNSGKAPSDDTARDLLETVKVYNPAPAGDEEAYAMALLREYAAFCEKQKAKA
ncbi:MAG: putative zinc-binding protein [Chloroflexi bacterium]|nr:putative zinc-binding protein [Chloroflexota bacterium]